MMMMMVMMMMMMMVMIFFSTGTCPNYLSTAVFGKCFIAINLLFL